VIVEGRLVSNVTRSICIAPSAAASHLQIHSYIEAADAQERERVGQGTAHVIVGKIRQEVIHLFEG